MRTDTTLRVAPTARTPAPAPTELTQVRHGTTSLAETAENMPAVTFARCTLSNQLVDNTRRMDERSKKKTHVGQIRSTYAQLLVPSADLELDFGQRGRKWIPLPSTAAGSALARRFASLSTRSMP